MSDHAPHDSMGLSDLDGFLTGIAVGPELILPSEWLPVIWGGDEPVFDTDSEMRAVLGTIMGRYNEIVACINADPEAIEPMFWEGPQGEVVASDWANGFLDAVALRPEAWEPLITHRRAGIMMMPSYCSTVMPHSMRGLIVRWIGTHFLPRCPTSSRPASPAFTSFGETIKSLRPAEVAASREATDARNATTGIDRRNEGSDRPDRLRRSSMQPMRLV
jgi:yecA family protein